MQRQKHNIPAAWPEIAGRKMGSSKFKLVDVLKRRLNVCDVSRPVDYLIKMERIGSSIALLSTNKFRYLVAMALFELSITTTRKK